MSFFAIHAIAFLYFINHPKGPPLTTNKIDAMDDVGNKGKKNDV